MATRFYVHSTVAAPVSPPFDANWEQTGQAVRRLLIPKLLLQQYDALTDLSVTVPITTTQDILVVQAVSMPLRRKVIAGTVSAVIRASQNATTNNAQLAAVVKLVSQDGSIVRGVLLSNFAIDTAFALTGAPATRIASALALTQQTADECDRLVVELGVHAAAPSAAGSAILRPGIGGLTDFALTSALTTDLNPWVELSQDVFPPVDNNYQSVKVGSGMSTTERMR